jgi:hypothetical protein
MLFRIEFYTLSDGRDIAEVEAETLAQAIEILAADNNKTFAQYKSHSAPKRVHALLPTIVMNLASHEKKTYFCSPENAVIAAYAQEHGDWNTWDYQTRYANLLEYGEHTVLCGDWSAFACTCHSLDA